jgi:hypothetical protein
MIIMINLYLLCIIIPFLINYILLTIFKTMETSSKIIFGFLSTSLIIYLLFRYESQLDDVENKFVKYTLVIFLLFCIYKFVETIYSYGPMNTYSITLIIIVVGVLFILMNVKSFNTAFNNVYPSKNK